MKNNNLLNAPTATEILLNSSTIDVATQVSTQHSKPDTAKVISSLKGYNISSSPIVGRSASYIHLEKLNRRLGDEFWVKVNNNIIYKGTVTKAGFNLRPQVKLKDENGKEVVDTNKKPIWVNDGNHCYRDGYAFLEEEAQKPDREIFIIPNHTIGGITKHHVKDFWQFFLEADDISIDEQWELANEMHSRFGIVPSAIVFSGGKSLHINYSLSSPTDGETWKRITHKLIALFRSDRSIENFNREMRFAGFTRLAKGTHQSLEFESNECYSPEEFESRIDSTGLFPYGMSDNRWEEVRLALANKELSHEEKDAAIAKALSTREEELPEVKRIQQREERKREWESKSELRRGLGFSLSGESSLIEAVKTWETEGGKNLFDWPGHDWKDVGTRHQGYCPWHDSKSGTSAWIHEADNGGWLFHCPSCTGNKAIGALTYQYSLQYSTITHPTGKYWAEFAKRITGFVDAPFNPTPEEKEDWKERYERARIEKAIFKFTRKADITVESGYLPKLKLSDIPSEYIGLKGDWGIGKTTLIAGFCRGYTGKILQLMHLNALGENTAPKFGCIHHKSLKANGDYDSLHGREGSRMALTIDSLGSQLDPEKWAWGQKFILILDEIEQVLDYAHHSPNIKGNRLAVRAKLIWLIKNAEYIISSDRDLCDATLDFIAGIRGDGKKAYLIHHTEQKGLGRTIKVNTNTTKDVVLDRMLWDVRAGKKIAIACENRSDLLMIEEMLVRAGVTDKEFFFAHGDNSNEKGIKEIISQINEEYTNYNILGYTMTLGTAVSLEIPHFDKVYGFFTGDAFGAGKQAQMLFRYRIETEIEIWVNPRKSILEINEEKMLKDLTRSEKENGVFLARFEKLDHLTQLGACPTIDGSIPASEMDWLMHGFGIKARENASMANPSKSLCDLLESAGFHLEIECTEGGEKNLTGEEGREIKKEIKEKDDIAIAHAKLLTDDEYKEALKGSGSLTKEQRNELKKTFLNKETGLEVTPELVKKERTKNFTSAVKMLRIILGSEEDAIAADLTQAEGKSVRDKKYYSLRRNLFIKLGAVDLIDYLVGGGSYASKGENSLVKEVANNIRANKGDIKRLLGYKVNTAKITKDAIGGEIDPALQKYKVSDANLVNELLGKLAIKPVGTDKMVIGERFRIYSLDPQNWDEITGVIEHQKTLKNTPKWDTFLEAKKAKFLEAESQAQQTLDRYTPPTTVSYIKDQGGVELNQASEMTIKIEQKLQPQKVELLDPTLEEKSALVFGDAPVNTPYMGLYFTPKPKPAIADTTDPTVTERLKARIAEIKAKSQLETAIKF